MLANVGQALALSVVLIAWAALMRSLTGTWLQPGSFFSLWWCFAGIGPLIVAPQERVGPNAMVWLIAACVAVSLGGIAGNWGLQTRRMIAPQPATDRELKTFTWLIAASIVLGIGSNVAFVQGSGINLADTLDIERLVVVSNQLYVSRYAEVPVSPPRLAQALLPFVYLGPALGGILFVLARSRKTQLLTFGTLIPAVMVTVLQTTKAAVLWAVSLWLSGYFAARLRSGKVRVFTRGHVIAAATVGAAMVVFFFAVGLARLSSTDVSLLDVVFLKLVTAAFGHMTLFSQWLAEYWAQPFEPSLGMVTFAGPLEMLGLTHRIAGIFESIIELVAGETSNIYTGFRPLIQDFTIPGALSILVLLGFIGGAGFRLVGSGRWSGAPLLIAAYVTIFWTPITWFWLYNSLTATVVALGLIVWFVRLWRGARSRSIKEQSVSTA